MPDNQPDTIKEDVIASGEIKHLSYKQALALATGGKKLYFSASQKAKAVEAPTEGEAPAAAVVETAADASANGEKSFVTSKKGATYLNADGGEEKMHFVTANVMDIMYTNDKLASAIASGDALDEDIICELPIVFRLKSSEKQIADITEDEARDAGYGRRELQFRLAAQTNDYKAFEKLIRTEMLPLILPRVITGLPPLHSLSSAERAQANEAINQTLRANPQAASYIQEIGKQVLRKIGLYPPASYKIQDDLDDKASEVVAELYETISDRDIPGTTDVYHMRLAKTEEIVDLGKASCPSEADHKLGSALRIIHDTLSPYGLLAKPLRDEMARRNGSRKFIKIMNELADTANTLLGENVKPEISKTDLTATVRVNGRQMGDVNRTSLLKELEEIDPADMDKLRKVKAKIDDAMEKGAKIREGGGRSVA